MNVSGRRQERLVQLAHKAGYTTTDPRLTLQRPLTITPTAIDHEYVAAILSQNRAAAFKAKSHMLRRKPSKGPYNTVEKSAALNTLIVNTCSASQLAALLASGADVNFLARKSTSTWKRLRKKDQLDQRNTVLTLSIERKQIDLCRLLARSADQENIDAALGAVLYDLDDDASPFLEVLLSCGADANHYATAFVSFVKDRRNEVVYRMSSGTVALTSSTATKGLYDAVSGGDLRTISMLLWHGADVKYDSALALGRALSLDRLDITAALCLAKKAPTEAHLASATATVCGNSTLDDSFQLRLVEMLLAAGAVGAEVEQALVRATKDSKHDLVSLLIKYGACASSHAIDNIQTAMSKGDMHLFTLLLNAELPPVALDAALAFCWTLRAALPRSIWVQMIKDIASKGVRELALGAALLEASTYRDLEVASILVQHGASANYIDGEGLKKAVTNLDFDMVKILVCSRPETSFLVEALIQLTGVLTDDHLHIASVLLEAGAKGPRVNDLLKDVVNNLGRNANNDAFITMLVRHGADVNVAQGECFSSVASRADIKTLSTLLKGAHSPASTARGIFAAQAISDSGQRYSIMDLLFSNGATGLDVDRTLPAIINRSQECLRFVQLFLEKGRANVDYQHGESLVVAAGCINLPVLQSLVSRRPSNESLGCCLTASTKIGKQDVCRLFCNTILDNGATGDPVHQALVDVVRTTPTDHHLVRTLLSYNASLDFDEAHAIRLSAARGDYKLLSLLFTKPVKRSSLVGALAVASKIKAPNERLYCTEAVLSQEGKHLLVGEMSRLLHTTFDDTEDLRILNCFLHNRASVNYDSGNAIQKAIKIGNEKALHVLLSHDPSATTRQKVFETAWDLQGPLRMDALRQILETPEQTTAINTSHWLLQALKEERVSGDLLSLLLANGASVHCDGNKPLRLAIDRSDPNLLSQLLYSKTCRADVSKVFEESIKEGSHWLSRTNVQCLDLLLDHGAGGMPVDKALLQCVQNHIVCPEDFIDRLINNGASVDYCDGLALKIATKSAKVSLVEKLMYSGPSRAIMEAALPGVFLSERSEDSSLKVMEAYFHQDPGIDLNTEQTGFGGILFESMMRWPRSALMIEKLLSNGADPNQRISFKTANGQSIDQVNTVLWAICKPTEPSVSHEVFEALLKYEADLNYSSPVLATPLIASAGQSKGTEIVDLLLKYGADVNLQDKDGKSPLFYASRQGNVATMNALVEAGSSTKDGSLHETARTCNHSAIKLLLEAGHDPNLPSPLHQRRSALVELITQQRDGRIELAKISSTIDLLISGGAEKTLRVDGKSLLLIALDSTCATNMTTALLDSFMHSLINENFNLYHHSNYIYSPLFYLKKGLQKSAPSLKTELIRIIEAYGGCACPVYYRTDDGAQPADYTGAPHSVVSREESRKARVQHQLEEQEDHEISRAQAAERAQDAQRLSQQAHRLSLQQDAERNRQLARQERERQLEAERFDEHRRNADLTHQRSLRHSELEAARSENRQEIEYKRQLRLEDRATQEERVAADRQIARIKSKSLKDEDASHASRTRREREVIEAKREGMREQGKLFERQSDLLRSIERSPMNARGRIGGAHEQRQLGWIEEID
ncbi:MAG: hypothetical protein M1828_003781 [Chrysothrix sp. TS-e1954]|nr:MAG: hypothetical protein M1828_003781 [Chrysothrix sp. TS-e1954]